jgi:hypothetical protein
MVKSALCADNLPIAGRGDGLLETQSEIVGAWFATLMIESGPELAVSLKPNECG